MHSENVVLKSRHTIIIIVFLCDGPKFDVEQNNTENSLKASPMRTCCMSILRYHKLQNYSSMIVMMFVAAIVAAAVTDG